MDHVQSNIHTEQFENGLTLVAEEMPWLQSAAFALFVPTAVRHEDERNRGVANLLCDWIQRGSGNLSNREFVESLDNLGVSRGEGVSASHMTFSGKMLAENLEPTLQIYSDLLQKPHFPRELFDESKQVCFQELRALKDDLHQQTMLNLRRQIYVDPWGWHPVGTAETVEQLTDDVALDFFSKWFGPEETIIAVAGGIEWQWVRDKIFELFGNWKRQPAGKTFMGQLQPSYVHLPHDSSQTHVAIGFDSVPSSNPDFYQARAAIGVMSDGMSSRLFSEVREKRALCYTVYASCHSLKDQGAVAAYAGTSSERAQETLDVMLEQFEQLVDGVHEDELRRLKARFKSGLVMQQESSGSRTMSLASDWYHLGRIRTTSELEEIVDGINCDTINAYLKKNPPKNYRVTTMGAERLEVPSGISSIDAG